MKRWRDFFILNTIKKELNRCDSAPCGEEEIRMPTTSGVGIETSYASSRLSFILMYFWMKASSLSLFRFFILVLSAIASALVGFVIYPTNIHGLYLEEKFSIPALCLFNLSSMFCV